MISVIVPVYNTEKYLKKCINSLLMQTYKELQIILVNDGSADNSLSVMKEFEERDSRILVIDRKHEGVSATRNAGIQVATGEFVSFIDSDDWIAPETYQVVLDLLQENSADIVYYGWTEEYSDGTSTTKGHKGETKVVIDGEEVIKRYFRNDIPLHLSSALLKTSLLKGVSFEVGRESGEDMLVDFMVIAKSNRLVYIDMPMYHRYNRVGSLANQLSFNRSYYGQATCTDIMIEYIQKYKPELLQEAYAFSFNFYMVTLNYLLYYRCEKENLDIYTAIKKRLRVLWKLMDSPIKRLPKEVSCAYMVFLINKAIYHYVMVIYYRYIKKELGGRRQK